MFWKRVLEALHPTSPGRIMRLFPLASAFAAAVLVLLSGGTELHAQRSAPLGSPVVAVHPAQSAEPADSTAARITVARPAL